MSDRPVSQSKRTALFTDTLNVWAIPLDIERVDESWFDVLDKYERERANKFRFPDHRRRFLAAHYAQRSILAEILSLTPAQIEFQHGPHGKPSLQHQVELDLHFNLSHSHELAVLAITADREVGIDIEWRARPMAFDGVAERFFFPTEAAVVRQTPDEQKRRIFYDIWTRKESYLKARGIGLGLGPELFSVVPVGPESNAFRIDELGIEERDRWRIWDISGLGGYAAALTVEGPGRLSLRMWNWPNDSAEFREPPLSVSLD